MSSSPDYSSPGLFYMQPEGSGERLGIAIADKDEEAELRWFLTDSYTNENKWYQGRFEVRPTELPDDQFADYQVHDFEINKNTNNTMKMVMEFHDVSCEIVIVFFRTIMSKS